MKRTIAIAGLGAAAAHIHLPAYKKIPGLQVVGGVDPCAGSRNFPFPLFDSVEQMLTRTAPDILTIAAPPDVHFELIQAGLRAGVHVFCEKPFVPSLEEADEVIARAKAAGVWVVVNNEFRFMNVHAAAKSYISKPEFGDLLFISMQQTFRETEDTESGWRGRDTRHTCLEFGIHALDLCRFFFDEDPHAITARMPKPGNPNRPDYLNLIQLEFSGDRVAHISLDRLSQGPHRYLDTRLDGTLGCIETSLGGTAEVRAGISGGTRRPYAALDIAPGGQARLYHAGTAKKVATDPLNIFAHSTARLMSQFLDAIETGRTPPCHAGDNRRTLALMLAAYESQESNAPVSMI
jgi:predicted dehydrogenase